MTLNGMLIYVLNTLLLNLACRGILMVLNAEAGKYGAFHYIPARPGLPILPHDSFPTNFRGLLKLHCT